MQPLTAQQCASCLAPLDAGDARDGKVECRYCGAIYAVADRGDVLYGPDLSKLTPDVGLWCETSRLFYDKARQVLVCHMPQKHTLGIIPSPGSFDDIDARASFRIFQAGDVAKVGLEVRRQAGVASYIVWYTPKGLFTVLYMPLSGGNAETLVPWSTCPSFKTGPDADNELRVVCQGDRIRIYFNGALCSSIRDSKIKHGHVRVLLGTPNAPLLVGVSAFEVRAAADEAPATPPPAPAPPPAVAPAGRAVTLEAIDPRRKIETIKVVRESTGIGLADAKRLVESTPQVLKAGIDDTAAAALVALLKRVGARARVS